MIEYPTFMMLHINILEKNATQRQKLNVITRNQNKIEMSQRLKCS